MRVASTQFHTTMNTALQMAQSRVEKVMQQMATGQRVLLPSDDPIASVRLARLSREESALDQYRDNIGALAVRLRQNEVLLDGMSRDMLQMRDLLVRKQETNGAEKGSWDPKGDKDGHDGGRLYVTCLSTFILEVYYRHLPIYAKIAL